MSLLLRLGILFSTCCSVLSANPVAAPEPSPEAKQVYTEAVMWSARNDWPKGIALMTKAANLNHPQAAYLLAGYYKQGHWVAKDLNLAMKWARRAYELKYPGSDSTLISLLTADRTNQAAMDEARAILAKAEAENPKWFFLPEMRAMVAGTPIPTLPSPPLQAKAAPAANRCPTCGGSGRVIRVITTTKYDGRWGNNPWVTKTTETGPREVTCEACRGRGKTGG